MTRAVLGIDTSCYTTSAAFVTSEGQILGAARRLLTVPDEARGLRQSEGLFQHVNRLPEIIAEAASQAGSVQIEAVAASVRPRPDPSSYMPVFRAGESQARAAATLLNVPFIPVSHQEGHIRAALIDSAIDRTQPFLAFHLSGGTTEVLLCREGFIELIGGSLDLHAGQLVDRVGVRLHLPFPAGPELEKLAVKGNPEGLLGVSLRGISCSIAGAETRAMKLIDEGMLTPERIAAEVFDFLARTITRQIEAACAETQCNQILLAGGVASSRLLRQMIETRAKKRGLRVLICYARPELSGDNAVGVALLGADQLNGGIRT